MLSAAYIALTLSSGAKACDDCERQSKSLSQALKRAFVVAIVVRAKARTYLRCKGNSKGNDKSKGEKQIPFRDDNKKGKGNCVSSPSFRKALRDRLPFFSRRLCGTRVQLL